MELGCRSNDAERNVLGIWMVRDGRRWCERAGERGATGEARGGTRCLFGTTGWEAYNSETDNSRTSNGQFTEFHGIGVSLGLGVAEVSLGG